MAGQIRLNVEGLQNSSNQLKGKGNELESWINEVQRLIDGLTECWEGDAAEAYRDQFARLRNPGLNDTRELIETIAVQIDQTLAAAQELDANIASKLG